MKSQNWSGCRKGEGEYFKANGAKLSEIINQKLSDKNSKKISMKQLKIFEGLAKIFNFTDFYLVITQTIRALVIQFRLEKICKITCSLL